MFVQNKGLVTRLRPSTKVKQGAEETYKNVLLDIGVHALYEPLDLYYGKLKGQRNSYCPDFLLPHNYINGKPVILEPHAGYLLDMDYLKKIDIVRETYGLYIVVSSGFGNFRPDNQRVEDVMNHGSIFVDELWLSNYRDLDLDLRWNITRLLKESEVRSESALPDLLKMSDMLRISIDNNGNGK